MASADLVREAQDPSTSAARLGELAQIDRGLWPAIAVHPAAYPALLEWLGQQGDPTVNAVLRLRASSPEVPASPPVPPAPPAPPAAPAPTVVPSVDETQQPEGSAVPTPPVEEPTATYAAPAGTPASSPTAPAPAGAAGGGNNGRNAWVVGGMLAVVLLMIGVVVFAATKVFGDDEGGGQPASSFQTLEPRPTVGLPDSDGDSASGDFCEKFTEARDALAGDPQAKPGAESVQATADIFRKIEAMAPADIRSDIGVMADYFETVSDPSKVDSSTVNDLVKEFTAAGKKVSTYYASHCM